VETRWKYFRPFIGYLKGRLLETVEEVTTERVEEYVSWMWKQGHARTGRPLARSSVGYQLWMLRQFFGYWVRRGVLAADPAGRVEWRVSRGGLPRNIPTEREMESILASPDTGMATGLRDRAILELMYSTGIRSEEAVDLDFGDLNVGEGTLTVADGKGGRGRTVPVGESALQFLNRYLRESRPLLAAVRPERGGVEPALFLSVEGAGMKKRFLGRRVGEYVRRMTPGARSGGHAIRHAFATHMLRGGANVALVQRMLGHTRLSTTGKYLQVAPVDLKAEHRKRHPRRKE
jgi:integrase/recombinase XerD